MKTLALAIILVARAALADCTPALYASSAITIVGQQGRPLPNTHVTITDRDGVPVGSYGGAFTDTSGCTPSTFVPPSGVYQFFTIDPGLWIVTINGEGVTRYYYTATGTGGFTDRKISIDRPAEVMVGVTAGMSLVCNSDRFPCAWVMPDTSTTIVGIDFIAPTFSIVSSSTLLSWFAGNAGAGNVAWRVDWCVYKVGEVQCAPDGTHGVTVISAVVPGFVRTDVSFSMVENWAPSDHVVIYFARMGAVDGDTYTGNALLENVRLEFTR